MTMDLPTLPVTLVVKAPSQKIADHTVECALDWSIRKLKQHLSTVYPSAPQTNEQRIIYSGKLLEDEIVLKDVLRQYEPNQTTHIVHLVCSNCGESNTNKTVNTNNDTSQSVNTPTQITVGSSEEASGLRHRNVPGSSSESHRSPSAPRTTRESLPADVTQNPHGAQQQTSHVNHTGMNNMHGMQNMPMMPGMPYSPEQIVWMQHMYAQQMAQYMQFFNGGAAPFINPVFPTPGGLPDAAGPLPGMANPEAQQAARPRPAGQQPIRMNAQGGAWVDDDDEDGMNRDWLDWVYTLSRFSVLLSIVYFYSSISRFVLVFGFFFFMYLYQGGWFRGRRDPAPVEEAEPVEQAANAVPPEPQQNPVEQLPEAPPQPEESETNTPQDEEPVAPAEPPPPGSLAVAWAFFSTFFTSLMPQQPVAVNAN